MRSRLLPVLAMACSALMACGGGDAGPAGRVDGAASAAPAPAAGVTAQEERTLCALLPPEEIAAAFSGRIRVAVNSGNERLCEYRILGYEGGQIALQRMSGETYDKRKRSYAKGSMKPSAVEGPGQDAYLVGDSQIEVKVSDSDAISLGVMLFVPGELPFTPEQARSAVIELAGRAAGRL